MHRFIEIGNSLLALSEIVEIEFQQVQQENNPPHTRLNPEHKTIRTIHVYLKNGEERIFEQSLNWKEQKEEILKALTRD